jgi:hypothetical protein
MIERDEELYPNVNRPHGSRVHCDMGSRKVWAVFGIRQIYIESSDCTASKL